MTYQFTNETEECPLSQAVVAVGTRKRVSTAEADADIELSPPKKGAIQQRDAAIVIESSESNIDASDGYIDTPEEGQKSKVEAKCIKGGIEDIIEMIGISDSERKANYRTAQSDKRKKNKKFTDLREALVNLVEALTETVHKINTIID